jgi:pyruvate dehydrogenase E2 component (dihydrolipoamide acetyltransferase)
MTPPAPRAPAHVLEPGARPPAGFPRDWRAVDWDRYVWTEDVAGARVSFADLGSGEPAVVFVHGLGGQWRNWLANLPAVAPHRRAIALDLPGFGSSAMPPERISIPGYARVVDALCDRLGLEQVVLVGNSMGGFVAAELAITNPARVEGLVLVDAAGLVPTPAEALQTIGFLWVAMVLSAELTAALPTISKRPGLRNLVLGRVANEPWRLPSDLLYYGLLAGEHPGVRDALTASVSYLSHAWSDRLAEIRCPTAVIWGSADRLIPVRHAVEFGRLIDGSVVSIIEGVGHIPMIESPGRFNRVLLQFLQGGEAEPAYAA